MAQPCTGQLETKISYVIKVGDLIVGVGAYLREGVWARAFLRLESAAPGPYGAAHLNPAVFKG